MTPSASAKILLIDNYDSFTYILRDYLLRLGARCTVLRNDALPLSEVPWAAHDALLLSPGPQRPADAGWLMPLLETCWGQIPMLGVCLGHQAIGELLGARLHKARSPMHGKTSPLWHDGQGLFEGIPSPTPVMRYHSLILSDLPDELIGCGHTPEGELMALRHRSLPVAGLQFHPESVLSSEGLAMLGNWLRGLPGRS